MTLFVQFVRARQLKAQSVQRSLEEVAVRQIEIEKESVEIGKLPKSHPHLHPNLYPFTPNLSPFYPNLNQFYPDLSPFYPSLALFSPN